MRIRPHLHTLNIHHRIPHAARNPAAARQHSMWPTAARHDSPTPRAHYGRFGEALTKFISFPIKRALGFTQHIGNSLAQIALNLHAPALALGTGAGISTPDLTVTYMMNEANELQCNTTPPHKAQLVAEGKLLRYYRVQANMNQKSLASAIGVTQKTISFWENGRQSSQNFRDAIATTFGIDTTNLLPTAENMARITARKRATPSLGNQHLIECAQWILQEQLRLRESVVDVRSIAEQRTELHAITNTGRIFRISIRVDSMGSALDLIS